MNAVIVYCETCRCDVEALGAFLGHGEDGPEYEIIFGLGGEIDDHETHERSGP